MTLKPFCRSITHSVAALRTARIGSFAHAPMPKCLACHVPHVMCPGATKPICMVLSLRCIVQCDDTKPLGILSFSYSFVAQILSIVPNSLKLTLNDT